MLVNVHVWLILVTEIFALSGGGIFKFQNGNSGWPWTSAAPNFCFGTLCISETKRTRKLTFGTLVGIYRY